MPNWIETLFSSQDFMPHGHCFLWDPEILWLHVVSDILVGVAYFSIPGAILYFANRRRDLPFRALYTLFGLFIVLCGTTHFMSVWVLWNPDYGVEGLIKAATAVASIISAYMVWKLMPMGLQMPSPAELQQMNARLRLVNERTEQEVANRTAELQSMNERLQESEKQLQDALEDARAASHAKSDFLANMSHEIRTPMNAIVGLTTYLTHTEGLSERQHECLKTIDVSASALMDLINDLLDISKIEARRVELDKTPFNLRTLVDDTMSIAAMRAKEKNIELVLRMSPNIPLDFVGDATRIRQILLNLLSNAVKFTERGSVTLSVNAESSPKPQYAMVTFEVTDTGIGIDPEKIPFIFDKFTQGDSSFKRKYGGSGLGLAIAQNFIQKMDGKIDVKSIPEKGSSFLVTLMLPLNKAAPDQPSQPDEETVVYFSEQKNKGHVLVIEDWQPNVLVASLMLEGLGYTYDVAHNGEEAIGFFQSRPYAAVLMDVRLPDMNGYDLTLYLRGIETKEGRPPTPIIATTAYAMKDDREKCLASGMNAYLSKPLETKILSEILETISKAANRNTPISDKCG